VTVAPDFAAPVLGWRAWLVLQRSDGVRLASVAQPTLWPLREELVGTCLAHPRLPFLRRHARRRHEAPSPACTCGIYAATDPDVAGPYVFRQLISRRGLVTRVIGLVSLWGRVLACERGWRAERGYPARIYVPIPAQDPGKWRHADDLALSLAEYGVPVDIVAHRGERDLVRALA
jgi:hypothetical protein